MIIDNNLLDKVTDEAKSSPRLRMNYNLHESGSVIFEVKDGPYMPSAPEDMME